jgi:mono/diheme cytochrome c family protein
MLVLVAALAAPVVVAGCGSDDAKQEAAARARAKAARQARLMAAGKRVFIKNCALCHTLEGRIAHPTFIESPIPNLDEVRPRASYVEERIVGGGIDMGISQFPEPTLRAVVAYVAGVAGRKVLDTSGREPEALPLGEQVYRDNCESCHAIDGRKMTGRPIFPGTDFNKVKPNQRMVRERVLEGAPGEMPPYRGKLTKEQLHALAVYVTATAGE